MLFAVKMHSAYNGWSQVAAAFAHITTGGPFVEKAAPNAPTIAPNGAAINVCHEWVDGNKHTVE